MINVGDIIDDRYEILKEIGRGGMSIVYLAMDNRLNKSIVVKDIRKKNNSNDKLLMESLKKESDLLKNLDHPSLPKIYDIIDDGDIYVVMDYIEGESLNQKLKREGAIPARDVIEWGKQLSTVLYYLHTRPIPIIYRDMKPDNVMLTPEGKIKLIDFGISREYKFENTTDTTNLGTRSFAAPEQIAGKQTDAKTDIYSLGVTLYNLVTAKSLNEPPFELRPIRTWNPALPEGLEYIITKCTHTEPEKRYADCNELLYDFNNIQKLTREYKINLLKQLSKFIVSFLLLLMFITVGIVGYVGVKNEKLSDYKGLINQADLYLLEGKYTEAIDILDNVIMNVDGRKSDAYIKIINIYENLNNVDDGIAKVEGYINDKYAGVNKNDEVLFKVAMTYLNIKNYPMALHYFKSVNENKITDAKYYKTLATSLSSLDIDYEEFQEELNQFEKYNNKLPNNEKKIMNYNSLANIYTSYKGSLKNANDKVINILDNAYDILLSMDDESLIINYEAELLNKLAQAYHSKGINEKDKSIAEEYYNKAIDLYQDILDIDGRQRESVLIKLGEIFNDLGNQVQAIEQFDIVIKEYPSSIKAYVKKINVILDIQQSKDDNSRDYTQALNVYKIVSNIEGSESDAEFKKIKRRLSNLGLL